MLTFGLCLLLDNAALVNGLSRWMVRFRLEALGASALTLIVLTILKLRTLRRHTGVEHGRASRLADALRAGALEFEGGPRMEGSIWDYKEEDEQQNKLVKYRPGANHSLYELLAYHISDEEPQQVVTVSYLNGGPNPDNLVREEDLFLGVPREFLKPELVRPEPDEPEQLELDVMDSDESDSPAILLGDSVDDRNSAESMLDRAEPSAA
jgi:hypothetical protein